MSKSSAQSDGSMSESLHESLSALMDGEANELELQRILASVDHDAVRAAWSGMHRNSDAMRGSAVIGVMDISRAVRLTVAGMDRPAATQTAAGGVRRSLVSFAVAASVTAVVVLGGQQLLTLSDGSAPAASPGLVNASGAMPVRASLGSRVEQPALLLQPASATGYQELARQRLRKYSQAHAEEAALNTPQGLVPFARVQDIQSQ